MKIPKLHSLRGLFDSDSTQAQAADLPTEQKLAPEADPGKLFRSLIGPVRAIAVKAEPNRPTPPAPDAAMSRADEAHVLVELAQLPNDANLLEAADRMVYLANGYPPKILRKLRRGQYKVQDEIDLHHLPQTAAKAVLAEFLHEVKRQQLSCVRLVHGKGLRSGDRGPVIKNMLDQDLRRRRDVIAFTSAPPAQGGTGALLLLLKTT